MKRLLSGTQTVQPMDAPAKRKTQPIPNTLRHWGTKLIEIIYPPRCVTCGKVDTHFCTDCRQAFITLPKQTHLTHFDELDVVAGSDHSEMIQQMIHALKYEDARFVSRWLAPRMAHSVLQTDWEPTCIVPVPLSQQRYDERGYNQAELLSEDLAIHLQLAHRPGALQRWRHTQTQVGLDTAERQENVAGAFDVPNPHMVNGECVLLVDDVLTTGATMRACADALRTAGAAQVVGVSVSAA